MAVVDFEGCLIVTLVLKVSFIFFGVNMKRNKNVSKEPCTHNSNVYFLNTLAWLRRLIFVVV